MRMAITIPRARPFMFSITPTAGFPQQPSAKLEETVDKSELFWSGVAHHPKKNILYAANRGTGFGTGNVVVFDTTTGKLIGRIPVDLIPYDLVPSEDGRFLYVSNLASKSVSVIDTAAMKVVASIAVGDNPNQMALSGDGRLFVACSNDNTVVVIDTKTRSVIEKTFDYALSACARRLHSQRAGFGSRQRIAVCRQRRQQRRRGGARGRAR